MYTLANILLLNAIPDTILIGLTALAALFVAEGTITCDENALHEKRPLMRLLESAGARLGILLSVVLMGLAWFTLVYVFDPGIVDNRNVTMAVGVMSGMTGIFTVAAYYALRMRQRIR